MAWGYLGIVERLVVQSDGRYLELTATHSHLGSASWPMLFNFLLLLIWMNSYLLWTDRVQLEIVCQVEVAD